jgi:hypothetical protein
MARVEVNMPKKRCSTEQSRESHTTSSNKRLRDFPCNVPLHHEQHFKKAKQYRDQEYQEVTQQQVDHHY